MKVLLEFLAWLSALVLALASLVPGQFRPTVGIDGGWEHALAYATASAMFTLAYSAQWVRVPLGLGACAGILEILQLFAIGRHAQFADFLASCLGIIAGSLLAQLLRWFMSASPQQK